jgi:hypothetical protein
MALFQKKTKMEKLQAIVSALQARASLLTDRRVSAQTALDAAMAARQAMLIDGDLGDDKLATKLQGAVDTAQSSLLGIIDAITALQFQIADAEAQLNAEQDRVKREAASEEIAKNVADVERLLPSWLAASRQIAAAFARVDHVFEAGQIGGFISGCAGEAEVAAAVVLVELRDLPKMVAAGDRPIPHRPDPVLPVTVIPPAPTQQLFCMRPIKWRDAQGQQRIAQKFTDANVTPSAASRGLACGALVPLDSPLRRQHHGSVEGHGRADLALDLDTEPMEASTPIDPIYASAPLSPFTVVVGNPIQMKVARQ